MEGAHCHSGDYRYCFHSILNLESSGIGPLGANSRLFITEINESGVPLREYYRISQKRTLKNSRNWLLFSEPKNPKNFNQILNNGTRIHYKFFLTDDERAQFSSLYFPPNPDNLDRFFEYNGKYYKYVPPTIS